MTPAYYQSQPNSATLVVRQQLQPSLFSVTNLTRPHLWGADTLCNDLDMPSGSTYAKGVEELRKQIREVIPLTAEEQLEAIVEVMDKDIAGYFASGVKSVLRSVVRFNALTPEGHAAPAVEHDHIVVLFANELKKLYPSFDTKQFMKDCKYGKKVTKADAAVGFSVSRH
jgi:hypothetical protein